jgi:nucleotide sugar dehydrogenase
MKSMIFNLEPEEIKGKITKGEIKIAIFGIGRVGLPLAIAFLNAGAKVIGIVRTEESIKEILSFKKMQDEPGINDALKKHIDSKSFEITTDAIKASIESSIKIVTVPVTYDKEKNLIDFSNLIDVHSKIGKGLKKGDIVITETSIPPGTTRKIIKPILEKESNLIAGKDFGLAYSPERIYEGRALKDITENYPKIVGADDEKSLNVASSIYECIAKKGIIKMSSTISAEAEKLFEGIYRDVNIALANELAIFCNIFGIDYLEARNAANSQPFCHLHLPGTGVGGYCLPFYSYFISKIAEEEGFNTSLIKIARKINEDMPNYIVKLLISIANDKNIYLKNSKIAILGLSFRGNIADTRLSPSYELIEKLNKLNSKVYVFDPFISWEDEEVKKRGGIQCKNLKEALENAEILIVATEHDQFKKINISELYDFSNKKLKIIIDGRNILDKSTLPSKILYVGIGTGVFYKN